MEQDNQHKTLMTVLAFAVVVAIGYMEYAIGPEISFSVFYLVPVFLASLYGGRGQGVYVSIAAGVVSLLAQVDSKIVYPHPAIRYWNAFGLLAIFFITARTLSRLKSSFRRERELSRIDFLTGVANVRAFHDVVYVEQNRARRYRHPVTLAYLDVDNFKQVNDRFGHTAGDMLLVSVAGAIRDNLRATDTVGRVGGDEFAILFPETGEEAAHAALAKLQKVLLEKIELHQWAVTFSIGVVTFLSQPDTIDDMIREADKLMYRVKNNGKNNVAFTMMG